MSNSVHDISDTQHRQVEASRAWVDEGMVELLEAVWAASIDTQFSCQGGPDENDWMHPGMIMFPTVDDAVRFLQATAERMEHYEYGCLAMSLAKPWHRDPSGPLRAAVEWSYELTPILSAAWVDPPCVCGHPFGEHFWRCECGATNFDRLGIIGEAFIECRECDAERPEWPTRCDRCPCNGFIPPDAADEARLLGLGDL